MATSSPGNSVTTTMTNRMETTARLAVMLPEDMSEGWTSKSLSFLHPVVVVQDQRSLHPETSDCPNSGGKQTFLD